MTADEAFHLTRDVLASQLFASAQAQGLKLSIGILTGMAETALEASGFRALAGAVIAADVAVVAYDGQFEETLPDDVADARDEWSARRGGLADFPNLSGLVVLA